LCADVSEHYYRLYSSFWAIPASEFCADVSEHSLTSVVFLLLGDPPASEFYVPTFRNTLPILSVVFFHLGNSPASEFYVPTFRNTVPFSNTRPTQMEQNVPTRRHMKFRRRGITQKKEYNIAPYFLTVSDSNMADFTLSCWQLKNQWSWARLSSLRR
jgi:hypothetical protein